MQRHMRIVLLSWVNEVCAEMRFSRITLHTSLALIDHYFLRATYIIPIEEFQVSGVTSRLELNLEPLNHELRVVISTPCDTAEFHHASRPCFLCNFP